MSENINHEIYTELANRIYDLDAEVYHVLGSSLGRTQWFMVQAKQQRQFLNVL